MPTDPASRWAKLLICWLWLTSAADLFLAAGLISSDLAVVFRQQIRSLEVPGQFTIAGMLLMLAWGIAHRAWWLKWMEAALLLAVTLAGANLIAVNRTGDLGALAVALTILSAWLVISAVHISRLISLWCLQRLGGWTDPPPDAHRRQRNLLAIALGLFVCLIADGLRVLAMNDIRTRDQATQRAQQIAQRQSWDTQASQAVHQFLEASKARDDVATATQAKKILDLMYVATDSLLSQLTTALSEVDEATAAKILDLLAKDDPQMPNEQSAWFLNAPREPHFRAAAQLIVYSTETQRPLELRQHAVETACRLIHGWSNMDQMLQTLEQSGEPKFAVAPLCRWLRRKPPAGHSTLPGRAAVCGFVKRWGQPDADTISALEFAETLADPQVQSAAHEALIAVKRK